MLSAMEDGEPLKLNRDESGEIKARVITLRGTFEVELKCSVSCKF
jgi:hypothetical protein